MIFSDKQLLVIFLVAIVGFFILPSPVKSEELLIGAWSNHIDRSDYAYNEKHDMIGIVLDNGYGITTFKNSIRNRSVLVGKWVDFRKYQYDNVHVRLGGSLGLATGYGYAIVPAGFLTLGIGTGVFTIDTSIGPLETGVVIINNLRVRF